MQSIYTAAEMAKAIGVSLRTLYAYLNLGLLPEGRRVGRQNVYGNQQLRYGLLVRALADGGMGLQAIKGLLPQLSEQQVLDATQGLSALLEARSRIEVELANATRWLESAPVDLDLHDMRLEDPVALSARVEAGEFELQYLNRRIERSFAEVRAQVLAESTEGRARSDGRTEGANTVTVGDTTEDGAPPGFVGLRADLHALNATLRDLALILACQVIEDGPARAAAADAAARLRAAGEAEGAL